MTEKRKFSHKSFRKILGIILVLVAFWFILGCLSAWYLTRRAPSSVSPLVDVSGFPVKEVSLQSADGIKISAWLIQNSRTKVVIILDGIRGYRENNLSRAELYLKEGFSVLLPDLRATGISEGDTITFGWQERLDVSACYTYLRGEGFSKISAHGRSLGAAAILYSLALSEKPSFSFLVLESCYDTIEHAFQNRMNFLPFPFFCYYPIVFFTEHFIGEEMSQLKPLGAVTYCESPALFMAGDREYQLKIEETKDLYKACSSSKELHIFKGGKHEDFLARFPSEYKEVLKRFQRKIKRE